MRKYEELSKIESWIVDKLWGRTFYEGEIERAKVRMQIEEYNRKSGLVSHKKDEDIKHLDDLMCTCMDICYKVADSRKEVFAKQSRVNEKDGLEKIPEIEVMELLQGKGKDSKV